MIEKLENMNPKTMKVLQIVLGVVMGVLTFGSLWLGSSIQGGFEYVTFLLILVALVGPRMLSRKINLNTKTYSVAMLISSVIMLTAMIIWLVASGQPFFEPQAGA